ncbi:MAG TPA: gephyrin-like molybdotransferase Glp [Hyphomicrobiaceae bacterium]|nr:gephyrin-like molybdotransferase Glp [Hyphomicrobiaceae bacterium]
MGPRLSDDCFLHDHQRLLHDQAIALLRERVQPIGAVETIALEAATGRILARPAQAVRPVPDHTNAAVDGYAFAFKDYDAEAGTTFAIAGRATAGHALPRPPPLGTAIRIFTGAVMPAAYDSVAMQEDCDLIAARGGRAAQVRIPVGLRAGANVRRAGEDVAAGETLFATGHVVRPQDLGALASIGLGEVDCYCRVRAAVVSTGDEIVRAGKADLAQGQVFDANAPMLQALARLARCAVDDLGVWPDLAGEVRSRLATAAQSYDVVLTSGGASRGEEDHMASALRELGSRHFWQLAVKPGRPMMFGQIGETIVIGLPGNPVAVFVCFLMYVWPMLRRLGGAPWTEPRRLRLKAVFAFPRRKTGRREFWRGMLIETDDGLAVDKFPRDGSGLISGLRAADGLIDIPEDMTGVRPGDLVSFIPFTEFGILSR